MILSADVVLTLSLGVVLLLLSFIMMNKFYRIKYFLSNGFSVISIMYASHLVMQLGSSVYFYLRNADLHSQKYFLACSLTSVLIPLGGIFGSLFIPHTESREEKYIYLPIDSRLSTKRLCLRYYFIFIMFCLALLIVFILKVESIPIEMLIKGIGKTDPSQVALARRSAKTLGRLFGMGSVFFMPLLFTMSFIGLTYFKTKTIKLLCLFGVLISFIYNAIPGAKTPVTMMFFLGTLVLIQQRNQEITIKSMFATFRSMKRFKRYTYIFLILMIILTILYPVYVFTMLPASDLGIGYLIKRITLRMVYLPAKSSYTAFTTYGDSREFTYFRDIYLLSDILGRDYEDISKIIAVEQGMGEFTNSPPAAIGNFYAQGGWTVVVIGVLFAAAIFRLFEAYFRRNRDKNLVTFSLYTMLIYGAFRFSWANYHTILATEVIIPMVLMLIIWNPFENKLKGNKTR